MYYISGYFVLWVLFNFVCNSLDKAVTKYIKLSKTAFSWTPIDK